MPARDGNADNDSILQACQACRLTITRNGYQLANVQCAAVAQLSMSKTSTRIFPSTSLEARSSGFRSSVARHILRGSTALHGVRRPGLPCPFLSVHARADSADNPSPPRLPFEFKHLAKVSHLARIVQ